MTIKTNDCKFKNDFIPVTNSWGLGLLGKSDANALAIAMAVVRHGVWLIGRGGVLYISICSLLDQTSWYIYYFAEVRGDFAQWISGAQGNCFAIAISVYPLGAQYDCSFKSGLDFCCLSISGEKGVWVVVSCKGKQWCLVILTCK